MKTIGFIDYYLGEWHANNYPGWIREICERTGAEFQVKYGWAEKEISPVYGESTAEWCKRFGVEECGSIAEVCEKADYILILAPSDPDKHLGYAREALRCGKNTYIDKTFAPDLATAKEIFAIAERYGTKFFSTSALRYASELDEIREPEEVAVKGGGSNLPEYIIHQIEMLVKSIRAAAKSVRVTSRGENRYFAEIAFEGGKRGTLEFDPEYGFEISAKERGGANKTLAVQSDFFKTLIAEILKFYESGALPFDPKETLEVMKIREGVIKGMNDLGKELVL